MLDSFFNNAIGIIFYLGLWSTMLTLVVMWFIRLNPKLQYWSALWKVSLILCLFPLFPWSYIEISLVEYSVVQQLVPELPNEWLANSVQAFSSRDSIEPQATETAIFHLVVLTSSSIVIISLLKILTFIYNIIRFNRSLEDYEALDNNASMMTFLTSEQRAFFKLKAYPYFTGVRVNFALCHRYLSSRYCSTN